MEDLEGVPACGRGPGWPATMPRQDAAGPARPRPSQEVRVARARELQRMLFDGGFAGSRVPGRVRRAGPDARAPAGVQRGGAWLRDAAAVQRPDARHPGADAPRLRDRGAEAAPPARHPARRRAVGAVPLRASGGSDLAGCITRATRDGDVWVLNGSKIWSSGAYWCDWAMCLARTDWDAPKHRGLTMFIVKIHQPGVHIEQIRQVNGASGVLPGVLRRRAHPGDRRGRRGQRRLDRRVAPAVPRAQLGRRRARPYVSGGGLEGGGGGTPPRQPLAGRAGRRGVGPARPRAGRRVAHPRRRARAAGRADGRGDARRRVPRRRPAPSCGCSAARRPCARPTSTSRSPARPRWRGPRARPSGSSATCSSAARARCLGGGSTEIARNIISERVLGMPREYAADRDVPFNQVKRNPLPSR